MGDVVITKAGPDRIADLEPLWAAMMERHRTIGWDVPGVPMRDPGDSWRRRRAEYERWLAEPGTFALVAEEDDRPVGYAFVGMHEPGDDTHATLERYAELHSLSVLPERRGAGIGTALLERVFEELREMGIREMVIGVSAANEGAMRLYARFGFRPWVTKLLGVVPEG